MKTGLMVSVYRNAEMRGMRDQFTERYSRAVLIGPGVDGPFEPSADAPELVLVRRTLGWGPAHYAIPRELVGRTDLHITFGGNYVATCDSRFREATGSSAPLPVHDHAITWEQSARNSI